MLVSDVNGKQVFSRSVTGPQQLDVPGLQAGHYVVKVQSARGEQVEKLDVR